jgi:hypothetical protein
MKAHIVTSKWGPDRALGGVVLRRLAVPYVERTGRSAQALSRGVLSLAITSLILMLLVPPGGFMANITYNAFFFVIDILALAYLLRVTYLIEHFDGDGEDAIPAEIVQLAPRLAALRLIYSVVILVALATLPTSHTASNLLGLGGNVFLVIGTYLLLCRVPKVARRIRGRRFARAVTPVRSTD